MIIAHGQTKWEKLYEMDQIKPNDGRTYIRCDYCGRTLVYNENQDMTRRRCGFCSAEIAEAFKNVYNGPLHQLVREINNYNKKHNVYLTYGEYVWRKENGLLEK